jgi:rsbT co-antagonist protein RsbR
MAQITGVGSPVHEIFSRAEESFLEEWVRDIRNFSRTTGSIPEVELQQECLRFFQAFHRGLEIAGTSKIDAAGWTEMRELLGEISRKRAIQGFTPTETARFVFSFKKPLSRRLTTVVRNPQDLSEQIWILWAQLDAFALYTTEVFLKNKEEIIWRAHEGMLELSTPVVKLWDGILAMPLIGTLDSARTQVVMETLLNAIVSTNSKVAILDITGVPTVDTIVAQHLLKTVAAARLMGADCIISGIRPQIAQTIVHLGINLLDVTTKATLSDALAVALERAGQQMVREEK